MLVGAQLKNSAIAQASTAKPYTAYTAAKPSAKDVAEYSTKYSDVSVSVDDSEDQNKALKKTLLWSSFAIAVGVVLLFILAKKAGWIKF